MGFASQKVHGGKRGGAGGASSHQNGPKFHAVIIGEPIVAGVTDLNAYPLSPVSPSMELPYALLPVCNTPIIDYILENLVENGVNEVTVMLNARSMAKVEGHLAQSRTARGKPWMSSDAITVNVLESHREIAKLADAVSEIRDRNVVPQSGSFLFVPIDCVSFIGNLREYLQIHLERARTISKYAATLLCTPAPERLHTVLHNVLARQLAEHEAEGAGGNGGIGQDSTGTGGGGNGNRPVGGHDGAADDPSSPFSERSTIGLVATANMGVADYGKCRHYAVPAQPAEHHTMFVMDKTTCVVSHMVRQEVGDEAPEPPLILFNKKQQQSVRMDLVPTGFLFVCCEALPLIEFHIRDIWEFLNTSLLGQVELFGNVFGVLEVPRQSALIDPVCGIDSYIQANIDVCARRLFPLTRESSFAEALAKYAVSSSSETVYYHTSAKVHGTQHAIGPNVVIGENVVVPASSNVSGVVIGGNVQLGEHTSLTSSVVMDGAMLGRNCTIRNSIIGYNVVIGDNADVSGCIVGPGCIIGGPANTVTGASASSAATSLSTTPPPAPIPTNGGGTGAAGVVLHKQAIVFDHGEEVNRRESSEHRSNRNIDSSSVSSGAASDDGSEGGGQRPDRREEARRAEAQTDHWLVGTGGLGRGLVERYEGNIAPTAVLFSEDPVPGKASGGSDGDDSSSDDEDVDETEDAFRRSIRRHVEAALLQPARIEASCYDMTTTCLSFQLGYPELCEVVTEMLVEHLLERHGAEGADACLSAANTLFGQWCRGFYDGFLSKNGNALIDAMVSTLEGMASAIRNRDCCLYLRAAELMEVLYCGCDDDMFDERGYCIVSPQGMIAFDTAMVRRRLNLEKYGGFPGVAKAAQLNASSSSSSSSEDDDDDENSSGISRDSVEEGKVMVASMCHPYIMGVKQYLEENGEL